MDVVLWPSGRYESWDAAYSRLLRPPFRGICFVDYSQGQLKYREAVAFGLSKSTAAWATVMRRIHGGHECTCSSFRHIAFVTGRDFGMVPFRTNVYICSRGDTLVPTF